MSDPLNLEARFEASKETHESPFQCLADTIGNVFICYNIGENDITLDGNFTIAQLEEILTFMRNHT